MYEGSRKTIRRQPVGLRLSPILHKPSLAKSTSVRKIQNGEGGGQCGGLPLNAFESPTVCRKRLMLATATVTVNAVAISCHIHKELTTAVVLDVTGGGALPALNTYFSPLSK